MSYKGDKGVGSHCLDLKKGFQKVELHKKERKKCVEARGAAK